MKFSVISAADGTYFPLLQDLLLSLQPLNIEISVIDLGLDQAQAAAITALGARLLRFAYPHDYPARTQVEARFKGFGAMLARPYLNEFAATSDVVMWMDADTWAQDPAAVLEILDQAAAHGLAAVPEVDRGYGKFLRAGGHIWEAEKRTYARCFGAQAAEFMWRLPVINSGVWAARLSSPLWTKWRQLLQGALSQLSEIDDESRIVEQAAFNLAIETENIAVRRFPATYNWLTCFSVPAWHLEKAMLVDPNPPHDPIRIVHISAHGIGKSMAMPLIGHTRKGIHAPGIRRGDIAQLRAHFSSPREMPSTA